MWSYFFSAWTLDISPLSFTAILGEDEEKVTVFFGAHRGDGYGFAVKWFQENIPDIDLETGMLTTEWSWTDDAAHLHIVHVWFPQGYALTKVTASNYTQEMLEGRVYVTFSGEGAPNGQFRWSVVAMKSASSASSSQNLTTSMGTQKEPIPHMLGQTALAILTMVVAVVGSAIYLAVRRRSHIGRVSQLYSNSNSLIHAILTPRRSCQSIHVCAHHKPPDSAFSHYTRPEALLSVLLSETTCSKQKYLIASLSYVMAREGC
jgi:hypothetical protein